jgi:hypothetical protein
MPAQNLISFAIPEADRTAILNAIETIKTKLSPYLIALTPQERQNLAKMSDKTLAFVSKTLSYCGSNPEFAPPYLNTTELSRDFEAARMLDEFENLLAPIESGLSDTIMLAGSEAYVASLSYYNTVKNGARLDVPSAKTIYEDLSKRFPQRGKEEITQPVT